MYCGNCGSTTAEVRPCHIKAQPDIKLQGDAWICYTCARKLIPQCFKESDFTPWSGHPCDECTAWAAFDGPISGMPEGIVCDQCNPRFLPHHGAWVCEHCFDKNHFGHRQKELQPILDRLSRL